MGVIRSSVFVVSGLIVSTTFANATTIGFTEGARPLVAGTTAISDNDNDSLPGFNLGTISSGGVSTINLFGRIETAHDIYQFQATSPFSVEFIFGGYDLAAGGHVSQSGFVADPTVAGDPGNTSDFKLRITAPADTLLGDMTYTTPFTSGNPFIFGATAAGTYRFRIDGDADGVLGGPAYYDLRVTANAVPGPIAGAGLPGLMMAGGGLLAWLRRRKGANAAA